VWIRGKQRFRAKEAPPLGLEKIAHLRREKRVVVRARIEIQQESAVRLESPGPDIVDKKFPIARTPFNPGAVWLARGAVKTNAVRRNEIELFAKLRQRKARLNSRDDARNIEVLYHRPKEWIIPCIESDAAVAEEPADIKKITWPTAKIKNAYGSSAIEPKILRAPDVNVDPVRRIVPCVDSSRASAPGINLANSADLVSLDHGQDPASIDRMDRACDVLIKTREAVRREEFSDFSA
jgi:hypothetical protein